MPGKSRAINRLFIGLLILFVQNSDAKPFGGEAETEAALGKGLKTGTVCSDYSGKGYVEGFSESSAAIVYDVNANKAAPFPVTIRYSAGDGDVPVLISLNGDEPREMVLPATPDWNTWCHKIFSIHVPKERANTISFRVKEGAAHDLHLDYLELRVRKKQPSVSARPVFSKAGQKAKLQAAQKKLKKAGLDSVVVVARNFINCGHNYDYFNHSFSAGGGLYLLKDGELKQLIDAWDGQILDCEISYDGKTAMFGWRKDEFTYYDIYTMNLDGTNLKQITHHPAHDFNPRWLPDGGIAFLSDRDNNYAYCAGSSSSVLYRVEPDGTGLKRLSANYLSDLTPHVMANGKIMYCRWEYVDRFQIPHQGLWAQNPDGSGLVHIYGQRVIEPISFSDAKSIPGSNKILANFTGHGGPLCGGIGIVDPSAGANNPAGSKTILGEAIPMKINRNRYSQHLYEYPYPVNEEYFLVSHDGAIELSTYEGVSEVILERDLVPGGEALGFFCALPVQTRQREPLIESALPENPRSEMATIIMQDVYIGLEKELKEGSMKRGDITQIRVVETKAKHNQGSQNQSAFCWQFPVVSGGATMEPKKTLATIEVEADGSAMFEVPAVKPIFFQALDKEGRVIQRMRTFTQFMPGEVQSCTGCHADRNRATPVNDRRIAALQKPPQKMNGAPWVEHKSAFSYMEQVQPILDAHCVACHNPIQEAGGLDLSGDRTDLFNVSYDNLVRTGINRNPTRSSAAAYEFTHKYISYIPSYNGVDSEYMKPEYFEPKSWGSYQSKLARMIRSGHCDEKGRARIQMTDLEKRTVYAWMDYNVPYYQTSHVNDAMSKHGMRERVPEGFDELLRDVAERRCARCHNKPSLSGVGGWYSWYDKTTDRRKPEPRRLPRDFYLRWEKPELNRFMLAPLATSAGGTQTCGEATFKDKNDPDYQLLLHAFDEIHEKINELPRMDMIGAEEIRTKEHSPLYTGKEQP